MIKASDIWKKYKPTVRVGERVRWGTPSYPREGVVIEDRGPLGVGGEQIVRVLYWVDLLADGRLEATETEVPVSWVEVLPDWSESLIAEYEALREEYPGWHRETSEGLKILVREWFDKLPQWQEDAIKSRAEVRKTEANRYAFKAIVSQDDFRLLEHGEAKTLAASFEAAEKRCREQIPRMEKWIRQESRGVKIPLYKFR